jgi:hypothetical protein
LSTKYIDSYNFEDLTEIEKMYVLSLKDKKSGKDKKYFIDLYNKYGDELLWKTASINKTIPEVAHTVIDNISSINNKDRWLKKHNTALKINNGFFRELDRVSLKIARFGISMCLIENGSIIRSVYNCVGCFSSGDLDVLINYNDFNKINEVLELEGYSKVFRHADGLDPISKGWQVYAIDIDDGISFYLNIQWVSVLRRWLPIGIEPSIINLIERSLEVSISSSKIRILSNEDNLFILCLHTASHSYIRSPSFRLHLDVERWVKNTKIDWNEFIFIVKSHQVCMRVWLSLYLAKYFLDTPIPNHVMDTLTPNKYITNIVLSIIKKNGLFNPNKPKFASYEHIILDILLTDKGIFYGARNAFFPPLDWLKIDYSVDGKQFPLLLYIKRIYDLVLRNRLT